MRLLRQLSELYEGPGDRLRVFGLLLVVLLGSTLEILGIGVFLPFMRIVGQPEAMLDHPRFGPVLRNLGVVDREGIILAASLSLVLLFAFKNLYLALQWRLLYRFIYRRMALVSEQIFRGYLLSPYTFHLERNTAELIRNISWEVKHAFANVFKPIIVVSAESAVTIGVIGMLFLVNPLAALAGLLVIGLLSWGIFRLSKQKLSRLGAVRGEEQTNKYQLMQHGLGAIREIRVLGREDYFLERFHRSEGRYVHALRDSQLLAQYPRLAIEMIAVAMLGSITAFLLLSGQQFADALAILVVFAVAVIRLVPAASRITAGVNQIRFYAPSVGIVQADRRHATEAAEQSRALNSGAAIAFRQALAFESVSYQYPEAPGPAIRELDLTIRRGGRVGFVGSSGAGKTTLMHLLLGLLQPTSGRIVIDGVDLKRNVGSWQRRIGYIPQELYLLDDTIRRNVAFGVPDEDIDDDAIWRALEAAQLSSAVGDLAQGLNSLTGERGARLSGGQAQRLAIARALYGDPEVLILDEATSALDYETEARIVSTLLDLPGARTLVIVSHRHRAVRDCDVIYRLDKGRIAAAGDLAEVSSAH